MFYILIYLPSYIYTYTLQVGLFVGLPLVDMRYAQPFESLFTVLEGMFYNDEAPFQAQEQALKRFAVEGNAICTLTFDAIDKNLISKQLSQVPYSHQERERIGEATVRGSNIRYVWVSHQQVAPQSNSSLSESEYFFPPSHACI